jgi:hypothetical protein
MDKQAILNAIDAAIARAVAGLEARLGVFGVFAKPVINEVVAAVQAEIAKVVDAI